MKSPEIFFKLKFSCVILSAFASHAWATDCSSWSDFTSTNPLLLPQSVEISRAQDYINGLETSEGVIFDIEQRENELWIDIVYVPNDATVISGLRAVMQLGRLVAGEFDRIVLSNDGKGVYQLSEATIREIGCQFIWGEEGGQNPIYLMRVFFENLELYPSGDKAVSGFTGRLFADTNIAMEFHNKQFAPAWMLSALE
jgi:hypothetical protein